MRHPSDAGAGAGHPPLTIDDPAIVNVLEMALEDEGYQVLAPDHPSRSMSTAPHKWHYKWHWLGTSTSTSVSTATASRSAP